MTTPLKRIPAFICALCMIFTLFADFCTTETLAYDEQIVEITKDGQVVDTFQGIDAEYVTYKSNTGYYCCASYVSRFYSKIYGVTVYNINMVDDKPSVSMYGHSVELKTVKNPLPGDIMQNKDYTHVAIVKEVNGSEVTLIEQNYKWNDYSTRKLVTRINRKCTASENYYYRLYIDGEEQKLDQSAPTISNAKASKISASGYTVSANVTDNTEVSYVKFGTYPKSKGKSAIKWSTVYSPSKYVSGTVKTSDFGNLDDTYVTIIRAYDKYGNMSSKTLSTYIDTTPPKISNIKISGITAKGYTVTCTVSDNSEIESVKFPTWTTKNSTDDLDKNWASGTVSDGDVNGSKAAFYVSTADHNNETGEYNTYIYAYDTYGNSSDKGVTVKISPATGISLNVQSITIEKGQSARLEHTLKGSDVTDEVTWLSSNKNTAAVSNGKVVGKGAGTATITAKTSGGKTAKCSVTVTDDIADMTFEKIADQYYTGSALKPEVTIKNGSKKLVKGTDYTVTYSANVNTGTAQVTVKGKGLYNGTKKLTFKICPSELKNAKVSKTGGNYINLTWSKYSGASGYYVYRYDASAKTYKRIADVKTNSYKDSSLASCTAYKYKVRAYYSKDKTIYYGKATGAISAVTNPLKTKASAVKSGNGIKVKWNLQKNSSGYQIYISKTGKEGSFTLAKTINDPASVSQKISSYSGWNYIKVRAFKNVGGKKQYGICSDVIKVKV